MAESFGPYVLRERLGRGGMGEVFRADDVQRGRVVALKVLPPALADDPGAVARFEREARLAANLDTPHAVPIHDFGAIDGRLFIAMRLVEGGDLGGLLAAGRIDPVRGLSICEQVAAALDDAHRAGLVHRDVKPANVLLQPRRAAGGRDFAYLADFGIARAFDSLTHLTASGSIVGTPAYMAPERFSGERDEDPRSDVYSLACVLFQVLTGRLPFDAPTLPKAMHAHLVVGPPRVTDVDPRLPAGLDPVLARGLAKDPDRRYATAGELVAAASAAVAAPAAGRTGPAGPSRGDAEKTVRPRTRRFVADEDPRAADRPRARPPVPTSRRSDVGAGFLSLFGGIGAAAVAGLIIWLVAVAASSSGLGSVLWIVAVAFVVSGVVAIVRGQLLWGIVLIVVALLIGPGGYSIFA